LATTFISTHHLHFIILNHQKKLCDTYCPYTQ